jgi:hypothetical protein
MPSARRAWRKDAAATDPGRRRSDPASCRKIVAFSPMLRRTRAQFLRPSHRIATHGQHDFGHNPNPAPAAATPSDRGIHMLHVIGRALTARFLPTQCFEQERSGRRRAAQARPQAGRSPTLHALGLLALCAIAAPTAWAQTVPLPGGTYSQNFDTLSNVAGSTTNSTLPTGWLVNETGGGARDNEQYAVDTGASNTGDTYSYGAAASTERALGSLRSGTLASVFGACFTNQTGNGFTSFDVAYTGEQWRLGTAARTDTLSFEYSLDATSLTTGTWVAVSALNFVTPNTATIGAKDGNAAGNRSAVGATVNGVSIANGASFCIRWSDLDASSADDGLAIDDFSLTVGGPGAPQLTVADAQVDEGDSGTRPIFFTFSLNTPAGAGGVTINYTTEDGTALAGSDYIASSSSAVIAEGATSVVASVLVNGDTATEADETFTLRITSATGADVADATAIGTIRNDDVTLVSIAQIQGSGLTSPMTGAIVTTEGIVTARKFNNGFFLQTADAEADSDPATSEGIFIFTSTAPPATAALGNRVRVTGTVAEFTPSSNLNQLSITQLTNATITVVTTGNPLPAPIALTSADFGGSANPGTAEKFEGMRVSATDARVVAPSEGNITESSANASTTGVFHVVLPDVARPFREPGIGVLDTIPIPGGKTPPRFDTNQERIMVRSRGQIDAVSLVVDVDAVVPSLVGVLDYFSGTWALLPDPATAVANGGKLATGVSEARGSDVTIAAFNLLRFFDEVNDGNGGPTLTAAALEKRLGKTSLAICEYLNAPDILGVVEVENLRVLGLLADRINSTCSRAPEYLPYLVDGNDPGGINVGFLVSSRVAGTGIRVDVLEVTQFGKNTVLVNPDTSASLLNDRPPLMLRAIVNHENGASYPVTVIVNHLRSLNGIDDTAAGSNGWATEGERVRTKRAKQAEFLAELVHDRQQANPNERIVLVGDFNAFEFNDGFADVMGIVRGNPAPEPEVLTYLPSPVTRPLIDGSELIPQAAERYSYVFAGNAQTLDHVLVNEPVVMDAGDLEVEHARINADFSVSRFADADTPVRTSDHDPVRLRITVPAFRSADLSVLPGVNPPSVRVGQTLTFSVEATNGGPDDAPNAVMTLTFDASVSPTVTAPAGWTCSPPVVESNQTRVSCTAPSLALDEVLAFSAEVVAGSNLANTTLTMTASIGSDVSDPTNANNSAAVSAAVVAEADMGIAASVDAANADVGGTARFTATVGNAGQDAAAFASAALVYDALVSPSTTAPAGWTCAAPVQDANTTTVTCTTPSFAVGASAAIVSDVPLPAALGDRNLSLAAATTSQYPDPDTSDNLALASVQVRSLADLAVVASANTPTVNAGSNAVYSVSVTNIGPNTASTASLALRFDAVVAATIVAPSGWTCTTPVAASGQTTATCTATAVASGANASFGLSFPTNNAMAGQTIALTATVSGGTADPSAANNSASAAANIVPVADVIVRAAPINPLISAGSDGGFAVSVGNNGPFASSSVSVLLRWNAVIAPVVVTPSGWTCSAPTANASETTATCSTAQLPVLGNVQLRSSFPTTAGMAGNSIQLTATVSSATADQVPSNNTSSASVMIGAAPAQSADLGLTVTGQAELSFTATNAGPDAAQAPRLVISGTISPSRVLTTAPAGWTCTTGPASAGGFRVVCTGASALASGQSVNIDLSLTAQGGGVNTTITGTLSSTTADPSVGNNTVVQPVRTFGAGTRSQRTSSQPAAQRPRSAVSSPAASRPAAVKSTRAPVAPRACNGRACQR